ncbi:Clavaminate synthase-like protein [Zopfia rhizophila CBS 207.26]|uniref:Clavaminate synthase-like protein n=1 Tax=Zopfia rhizophila CBS 207.26 TaxID=1314779 RepID=A0A6A6EG20_9PEZI|nr:Clavaminate synthase-like protein [Zopfia rhizophila CBS 207.26]
MRSYSTAAELNKLPPGFPTLFKGYGIWSPSDFGGPKDYQSILNPFDIAQIEAALRHFQSLLVSIDSVSRDNFPLAPELASKLKSVSKVVHNGRGFVVLRGLNPLKYTPQENVIIYCGICSYVAEQRASMIHICDRADGDQGAGSRAKFPPNETTIAMDFHTDVDAGDILSLYTLGMPEEGGNQHLVSFSTVYNDLAENDPQVLSALAKNWRYEMPIQNGVRIIERPIISFIDGHLEVNFATAFLTGSAHVRRLPGGPSVTEEQVRAIQVFLATCKKHSLALDQTYGDMLFVNNMSILHAREKFVNNVAKGRRRHLLSVMLRDPNMAWPKPVNIDQYIEEKFAQPEQFRLIRSANDRHD